MRPRRDRRSHLVPHPVRWAAWGSAATVVALSLGPARADRILLRSGGDLQGVILPDPAPPGKVWIQTRTAQRPFEFDKAKILRVEPYDDALQQYVERRAEPRPTASAELSLAQWCEEKGLTGPALTHYRLAAELDPALDEAHQKLGHVKHDGVWMTQDEAKQAQGLVKHKGKWISADKKEAIEARAAFGAEQESWARRLKLIRQRWLSNNPAAAAEAEAQLGAIREPAAVEPLLRTFGADAPGVQVRLAQWLGAIPGELASDALIRLILASDDLDVRQAALVTLKARQEPTTVNRFVQALRASDPRQVGRAAWALAELNATGAVPKLIPVLVKVQERTVVEDPVQPQPGISASFGGYAPGPILPGGGAAYAVPGTSGVIGPGGAATAAGVSSVPVLTGPVVGDGVVAFGATSVPMASYGSVSLSTNPNRPTMRIQTDVYRNEAVRLALRKLTGVDFGYEVNAWKRWVAQSYQPTPTTPGRRVPQP